jgi:putative iron-only hydrogenase system regulator
MEGIMEERVDLIGIVVEKYDSAERMNQILHEYGEYIIGRMGIPYKEKSMNIISVAVDAPMAIISTLSGKLGMLDGVSTKTIYAKSKREK